MSLHSSLKQSGATARHRNVLKRDNVIEALAICDATAGPVARLVKVAILNRDKGRDGVREALRLFLQGMLNASPRRAPASRGGSATRCTTPGPACPPRRVIACSSPSPRPTCPPRASTAVPDWA